MTPELTVLALAALLQAVQFALMSVPANLELGTGTTLGPRDPVSGQPPMAARLSPRTGRLYRAFGNHFEALILFTIAVVLVTLSGQSTPFTVACAWVYLGARILYIPAYAFGWTPWRSVLFAVGFAATFLIILATLF